MRTILLADMTLGNGPLELSFSAGTFVMLKASWNHEYCFEQPIDIKLFKGPHLLPIEGNDRPANLERCSKNQRELEIQKIQAEVRTYSILLIQLYLNYSLGQELPQSPQRVCHSALWSKSIHLGSDAAL
jgi:hypothetical protein